MEDYTIVFWLVPKAV